MFNLSELLECIYLAQTTPPQYRIGMQKMSLIMACLIITLFAPPIQPGKFSSFEYVLYFLFFGKAVYAVDDSKCYVMHDCVY